MSARFEAGAGVLVVDRRDGSIVAECRTHEWAEMIADGLNLVIEQVAPWAPGVRCTDVIDGQVVREYVIREIEP